MSPRSWIALFLLAGGASLALAQEPPSKPRPVGTAVPATDGKVWGALVYAVDDAADLTGSQAAAPKVVGDLAARLGKAFPQRHFEILGDHTQDVFREYESWVVPSADLFLKVDSKGPAEGGGVALHLQFWQEDQVLVKTDAVLRPESPLFIAGPKWRKGRLLFVLQLLESKE
ncbi:MAG: hypothetical protein KDK99_16140 [Verrucomicrobiales bacterium]|nr:hypothetical protein [Verrucomicrobiales bacterium]